MSTGGAPDGRTQMIVLASSSIHRADILRGAGLDFVVATPQIDERAVEAPLLDAGVDAAGVAEVLARAKAETVSQNYHDSHVIGGDQTLVLGNEVLHKPRDAEEARRRLLALSGRRHLLHTAVCIARRGQTEWSHVETAAIAFRALDPAFVGRHIAQVGDAALTSVGAYQIEGPGIQLIESVEGDFFAIKGLPLLPLLAELRARRLIDH
jgi:septum formation protein